MEKIKEKCDCEICKMTVSEAMQLAFLNFLLGEITTEQYYELTKYLKDYGKLHTNNELSRPNLYRQSSLFW